MSDVILSPNMDMPVPIVGVEVGPDWATDINACLSILDQHDHSPGRGVQITTTGININTDFPINGHNLTDVRTINFQSQGAPLPGVVPDLGALYVAGNELYYNDEVGNAVQITLSGTVNSGAGSITGLPSGTASVSYSSGPQTYIFQSATNQAGNIDVGSITIREVAPGANGITLSSPPALAADYTLILPSGLPSQQQVLAVDTAGNITYVSVGGSIVGPGGFTTIAAAIAATSPGGYISIPVGTYTENITLNKSLTIVGQGRGTIINGTWTFATGSDDSLVRQIKFGQGFVVNAGVIELQVDDMWIGNGFTITDNSGNTSNYYQGMQE